MKKKRCWASKRNGAKVFATEESCSKKRLRAILPKEDALRIVATQSTSVDASERGLAVRSLEINDALELRVSHNAGNQEETSKEENQKRVDNSSSSLRGLKKKIDLVSNAEGKTREYLKRKSSAARRDKSRLDEARKGTATRAQRWAHLRLASTGVVYQKRTQGQRRVGRRCSK